MRGYLYSHDADLLNAATLTADGLLGAMHPDGAIPGRLDERWQSSVDWVCMTGSAQIAECWLQLYEQTSNAAYLDSARTVNSYLRRSVSLDGPPEYRGAVRGSFPVGGEYNQYQYLSWAAKFFIDANLPEHAIVGQEE